MPSGMSGERIDDPELDPRYNTGTGGAGSGASGTPFFQTGFGNYFTQISTALLGGFGAGVGGALNNQQNQVIMQRRQDNTVLVLVLVVVIALALFFVFRKK